MGADRKITNRQIDEARLKKAKCWKMSVFFIEYLFDSADNFICY